MRYSRLSFLAVLLGVSAWALAGAPARAQSPCNPATNPLGASLAQVVEKPGGYLPGRLLEITLRVTAACWEQYEGAALLGISQMTPPGWQYDSLVMLGKAAVPDIIPAHGAEDEFGFIWDPAPELPVTLTYRLRVPERECNTKQLYGKVTYMLDGVPYESDLAVTDVPDARHKGDICCGEAPTGYPRGGASDLAVLAAVAVLVATGKARPHGRRS